MKIFIETPRLILRQWNATDYKPFVELNLDEDVMEFFPAVTPKEQTLAQIERISANITKNGYGFFAAERKDNAQFIGFVGLNQPGFESHFTPCIEIGWRLSKANWNHGFATEAARACLQFGFEELQLDEIFSFTAVQNLKSENVMKKIGMVHVGFFDHPSIADDNWLKKHILYRAAKTP